MGGEDVVGEVVEVEVEIEVDVDGANAARVVDDGEVVDEVVQVEVEGEGDVVVDVPGASATVILAEVTHTPAELSVITSAVAPGSDRVTARLATPSENTTSLPDEQLPRAGYTGDVPSGTSSGPENVRHCAPA